MIDNDVYRAMRNQLIAQLKESGIITSVIAGYPPEKNRLENAIYFYCTEETGYGWQGRRCAYDAHHLRQIETQKTEKAIQVACFYRGETGHEESFTALDLAATTRMIVNSLPFIDAMRKDDLGVQRAGKIQVRYVKNEHSEFDVQPLFDFNITFNRSIKPTTPIVHTLINTIHSI